MINIQDHKWKKKYPLTDQNAFIALVDVMGDDNAIVQAARTSFDGDAPYGIAISDKVKKWAEKKLYINLDHAQSISKNSNGITIHGIEEDYEYYTNNEYYKSIYGIYEKQLIEDRHLTRYLMNHQHSTPFEMVVVKFMVQVPMDCWRQWVRHRMASINEYSTRYTEALDFFQVTNQREWRTQSKDNKQGSSGYLETWPENWTINTNSNVIHIPGEAAKCYGAGQSPMPKTVGEYLSTEEEKFHKYAKKLYKERLDLGIAREQARKDLPLSTYTRAYWKSDLRNIFNFLKLRMDSHAQLEIRQFANAMFDIIKPLFPVACEAFEDYVLHAKSFSRMEMEELRSIISHFIDQGFEINKPASMTDREWKEFIDKIS